MPDQNYSNNTLISIIIPCFNHATYLKKAIDSVLQQSHKNVEIIVVDDESSDNTKEVAESYGAPVKYIFKENGGLSAARNTGLEYINGNYVVFLDADDWLYPDALQINLNYLLQNPKAAFVSGGFDRVNLEENTIEEKVRQIEKDHYIEFLQGNYVGVPAAVLYSRWILEKFKFNVAAPDSCGDYDLYLNITRSYPVVHHQEKIAAYRIHGANMSSNSPMMLASVLQVLKQQEKKLKTPREREAYEFGFQVWKNYYCSELYYKLRKRKIKPTFQILATLLKYKPTLLIKYILLNNIVVSKKLTYKRIG